MNPLSKQPPPAYDWRAAFKQADKLPATATGAEKAARGREFEKILSGMFREAGLQPRLGYRPKGEEVDGSFWTHNRTMLLEAKWTGDPHPASSLYQFRGKVEGKLAGTLGLFVSMAGFSPDAVDALIAGKELNLILMDGEDVRTIVDGKMNIVEALQRKLRAAGDSGTPFFPLSKRSLPPAQIGNQVVLVEGRFDARVLELIRQEYKATSPTTFLPVGGLANLVPLAKALSHTTEFSGVQKITMIVDADGINTRFESDLREALAAADELLSPEVIVADPDLDAVLGLVTPGSTWNERLRLRRMNDDQLREEIRRADLLTLAKQETSVATILRTVGILDDAPSRVDT